MKAGVASLMKFIFGGILHAPSDASHALPTAPWLLKQTKTCCESTPTFSSISVFPWLAYLG
jgi:hypothetical protein